MKIKNEKGISIYLALMVMSILLALSLGISTILFGQMKIMKEMGYSVIAFYAADTGIEKILYDDSQGIDIMTTCPESTPCLGNVGDANFSVIVISPGSLDCPSSVNYCVESVGIFKQTRRAINIVR